MSSNVDRTLQAAAEVPPKPEPPRNITVRTGLRVPPRAAPDRLPALDGPPNITVRTGLKLPPRS